MPEEHKKQIEMLTILTTTKLNEIEQVINSVDRLNELVFIGNQPKNLDDKCLILSEEKIQLPLDWYDFNPPYLLPKITFSPERLLALVFFQLGNIEQALQTISKSDELYYDLLIIAYLKYGETLQPEMISHCELQSSHNLAILYQYGVIISPPTFEVINNTYKEALQKSESIEHKAFTTKQYLNYLLDAQLYIKAEEVARDILQNKLSEEAQNALSIQLSAALFGQIEVPYNQNLLQEIQKLNAKTVIFLEEKNQQLQANFILMDTAEVANYQQDFPFAKNTIQTVINSFKEEDLPDFLGEALFKKAMILYNWSKNGSPQYYKAAINAFQDVLKVFQKSNFPQRYADAQHQLALIYSEMPATDAEKQLWASFAISSFQKALEFYNAEVYPSEYARICHNYATALMQLPPAKLGNHLEKAAQYFQEALEIRTIRYYPTERAITLLNYLELLWQSHNENEEVESQKLEEMKRYAKEIKILTEDENLQKQASEHLHNLEKLSKLTPQV